MYIAITTVTAILLGVGAVIVATAPPHTVTMATGAPGGAYHELGLRYRALLAQDGVDLRLVSTAGAIENLAKLRDSGSQVGAAFIQGGITNRSESPEIESLGTLFYEPLWIFTRLADERLLALNGTRLSIGPQGSASRQLAYQLLEKSGVHAQLFDLAPQAAGEKLVAGEIDSVFIVAAWDAPVVQRLLRAEGIVLRSFPRADALVRLFPFMDKLVVPAGVADLARNRPPADVLLVAPKASLAVRADLHPGIQYLLLNAAAKIHSEPGIFHKSGQFPAAEGIDVPLSAEAQRYYKSGRPFLYDLLPFWLATVGARLLVLIIPLALILYPLAKFLPEIYDWAMKARVAKLYNEMIAIERKLDTRRTEEGVKEVIADLERLDQRAHQLRMPTSYAGIIYMLRAHIDLVRERVAHDRPSHDVQRPDEQSMTLGRRM